jgi:hypothetical protein
LLLQQCGDSVVAGPRLPQPLPLGPGRVAERLGDYAVADDGSVADVAKRVRLEGIDVDVRKRAAIAASLVFRKYRTGNQACMFEA